MQPHSIGREALGPHATVLFGADQGKYPDGNSVLVRGRDASMLIDPSLSVRDASPALAVDQVLLTHAHEDHLAGLSSVSAGAISVHHHDLAALQHIDGLMALYGVPDEVVPVMTALVTERFHYAGWPSATGFGHGACYDLGGVTVTAVHAPGHTGGHCVFVIEPDGVVVCGDIDLSSFGPYYGDAASDLDDFERTLVEVASIPAAHYVTFHHKGVVHGHDAFRAAMVEYATAFERRDHALVALLSQPRSLDELVADGIVYRPGTRPVGFGESVERYSIRRHLQRLASSGVVAEFDGRWTLLA
jgi:glyoxylase-like metal-dependent hydrolase (beta-lactamase superfamily II)